MSDMKDKKPAEVEKKIKDLPPAKRVCMYSGYSPKDSVEDDWVLFGDIGWVIKRYEEEFKARYAIADNDGKWHARDDMYRIRDGKTNNTIGYLYLPDGDFCGKWAKCCIRGDWYLITDMIHVDEGEGEYLVSPYAYKENFIRDDFSGEMINRGRASPVCNSEKYKTIGHKSKQRSDVFAQCYHCEKWFEVKDVYVRPNLGVRYKDLTYCDACEMHLMKKDVIMPHNHDIYPPEIVVKRGVYRMVGGKLTKKFDESPRAHRLFGVEAEVEVGSVANRVPCALAALSHLGREFAICKHDGSLSGLREGGRGGDFGFEIVTAPSSLDVHRKKWAEIEKMPLFKHFRAWDTDTCGFHVHVSRESLSHLQIGRILAFVNHPANVPFITKIAGRKPQLYAVSTPQKMSRCLVIPARTDETRRVAINLTNEKTVEFRMFRGTIRGCHIIRNLEFVDALCDYCMPSERSLREMFDWRKLVEFVITNRVFDGKDSIPAWPRLSDWFAFNGMASPKKVFEKEPYVERKVVTVGKKKSVKTVTKYRYVLKDKKPEVVEPVEPGLEPGPPKVMAYTYDAIGLKKEEVF